MTNGNRVELPGTFHAARIAIDIVGDALFVDEPLARVPAMLQFRRAEFLQRADQFRVMRTHRAVLRQQFVERWRAPLVTGQQTGPDGAAFPAAPASPVMDWD